MCLLPGFFQLSQDLGFANDQGIQPAGHANQVPGRGFSFMVIQMLIQFARRESLIR